MHLFELFHDYCDDQFHRAWREQAHFVDITPVARWFYEDAERDQYNIAQDFPSLVAPWPLTWMEYKHPPAMRIGSQLQANPAAGKRTGAMVLSLEIDDGEEALRADVMQDLISLHLSGMRMRCIDGDAADQEHRRRARLDAMLDAGELPKWLLSATVVQELQSRRVLPWAGKYLYLDESGRAYPHVGMTIIAPYLEGTDEAGFTPFALALSLLHCKNVVLDDAPAGAKPQRRTHKHGPPKVTFKTLTVEPLRRQLHREAPGDAPDEHERIKRALHIARGHFKDYREGGGLFGKLHGLYWWEMHVRGSAATGAVVKDYEVRPPGFESGAGDLSPRK